MGETYNAHRAVKQIQFVISDNILIFCKTVDTVRVYGTSFLTITELLYLRIMMYFVLFHF